MSKLSDTVANARAQALQERVSKFREFLIKQFGEIPSVGSIIEMPTDDVFGSEPSQPTTRMVVMTGVGRVAGFASIAIGMVSERKLSIKNDPHSNYVYTYTKKDLKRAKIVGITHVDPLAYASNQFGWTDWLPLE